MIKPKMTSAIHNASLLKLLCFITFSEIIFIILEIVKKPEINSKIEPNHLNGSNTNLCINISVVNEFKANGNVEIDKFKHKNPTIKKVRRFFIKQHLLV